MQNTFACIIFCVSLDPNSTRRWHQDFKPMSKLRIQNPNVSAITRCCFRLSQLQHYKSASKIHWKAHPMRHCGEQIGWFPFHSFIAKKSRTRFLFLDYLCMVCLCRWKSFSCNNLESCSNIWRMWKQHRDGMWQTRLVQFQGRMFGELCTRRQFLWQWRGWMQLCRLLFLGPVRWWWLQATRDALWRLWSRQRRNVLRCSRLL